MPVPDPRTGTLYVWITSCFLFTCLIVGGALLFLYLLKPESETTTWYPVAGLVFISLPFVFWGITIAYIILSRLLGFRLGSSGNSPNAAAAAAAEADGMDENNGAMDVVVENDTRTSHESERPLALSMAT
uniref:Uncharacterized protein n=1 Tax=Kalanchoe fedtschenkoi TaxID=63787 RepID=A0A7N0TX12_KALFE